MDLEVRHFSNPGSRTTLLTAVTATQHCNNNDKLCGWFITNATMKQETQLNFTKTSVVYNKLLQHSKHNTLTPLSLGHGQIQLDTTWSDTTRKRCVKCPPQRTFFSQLHRPMIMTYSQAAASVTSHVLARASCVMSCRRHLFQACF